MASLHRVDIAASSTQTASGISEVVDISTQVGGSSQHLSGVFQLVVTGVTGTLPTLDAYVQMEMPDGTYNDIVSFAQVLGVSNRVAVIISQAPRGVFVEGPTRDGTLARGTVQDIPLGPRFRAKWVIGGTAGPSFTFAVKADLYD